MVKNVRILILTILVVLFATKALAQTYCYKYSHSVKDEVKIPGLIAKGTVFYFTFTNKKSNCYLTDKNGVYSCGYGQNTYKYMGTKNGILIYQECNQNMFRNGQDILYFSSDFRRLNWRCGFDDYSPNPNDHKCLRVLNFVSEPDAVDAPETLY